MRDLPDPPEFEVRVDVRNRRVVAYLRGELDIHTGPAFRDAVPKMLDQDADALVLDLAELEFCDSRGLGQIIALHNQAADRGLSFFLAGVAGQVGRVLQHTGFDQILDKLPES